MKIIAAIAGGIGNMIEMTAAVRTLRERLGYVVDIHTGGLVWSHAEVDPIFETKGCRVFNNGDWGKIANGCYDGIIPLGYGRPRNPKTYYNGLRVLNDTERQAVGFRASEVDISMNACRDLGVAEEDLIWRGDLNHNREYAECLDVVVANGFYRKASGYWDIKGYPRMKEVVSGLREHFPDYRIGCIGKDSKEAVAGAKDFTGIALLDAMTLIKHSRFVICTDSMAYHAACAFGKRCFPIFTATSRVKNYDARFHESAVIVGRSDLKCRDICQSRGAHWRKCVTKECQDIDPAKIVEGIVFGVLYGRPLEEAGNED